MDDPHSLLVLKQADEGKDVKLTARKLMQFIASVAKLKGVEFTEFHP